MRDFCHATLQMQRATDVTHTERVRRRCAHGPAPQAVRPHQSGGRQESTGDTRPPPRSQTLATLAAGEKYCYFSVQLVVALLLANGPCGSCSVGVRLAQRERTLPLVAQCGGRAPFQGGSSKRRTFKAPAH